MNFALKAAPFWKHRVCFGGRVLLSKTPGRLQRRSGVLLMHAYDGVHDAHDDCFSGSLRLGPVIPFFYPFFSKLL